MGILEFSNQHTALTAFIVFCIASVPIAIWG
jgi:hypothetical protein